MFEGKSVLVGTAPDSEDGLEDMLAQNHIKRQELRTFLQGPKQRPSEHGGPLGRHPGKNSAEAADAFARIKWRDVPVVRRSPTEKATDNPSHSKTCPLISHKTSLVASPPQLEEGHQDGKHNQSTRSVCASLVAARYKLYDLQMSESPESLDSESPDSQTTE